MIKAVIFDLDGTILDTLSDLMGATNGMLRYFSYPENPDPEFHKTVIGTGVRNYVTGSLPKDVPADEAHIDACVKKMREIYKEHLNDTTKPYPGIDRLMQFLTEQGIKINILSNKPNEQTQTLVSAWFSEYPICHAYGEREGIPRKPDPQAALAIAEDLGISPAEMAFVGDSGVDMQTGNNAGMLPIGVLWGFRKKEELLENGAKYLAQSAEDLIEMIKNN